MQPLTLRRIVPVGIPIAAAPRANASLFAFGAKSHGAMDRRVSMRANQGARSSTANPSRCSACAQYASVAGGVRNELVQLTVVPPPTHRPWRMLMALSLVLRAAESW